MVTFVLFATCSSETKFVRILQNEILFSLLHLVNSLIKSKTLQQLVKKTFLDTKSVLFCLMKICDWKWDLKGWTLNFVDSNPKCYKLSCCGSCSLGFFSFIQIALARLWNKAELPQVGIFFRTQFPSLGFFINKQVWNRKNRKN